MKIPTTVRRLIITGLVAASAVGFTACGSDDDASSDTDRGTALATEGTVEGVTWTVTELNGEAPPEGVTATLVFDGSSVSGRVDATTTTARRASTKTSSRSPTDSPGR